MNNWLLTPEEMGDWKEKRMELKIPPPTLPFVFVKLEPSKLPKDWRGRILK